MAAGINDKFKKVSADNSYAVATTVKTARTVGGGTTLEAFDLSKWADATAVNFLTYRKTTDPVTNITTVTNRTGWTALVNTGSNTLTNLTIAPGYTDLGHQVGDYIEPVPTSKWANDLVDGMLVTHNQDGTLKNKIATLGKINGGSTDGVLLTDASGNVTGGKVTAAKIDWTTQSTDASKPLYDSGWVAVPASTGHTSSLSARRIGNVVYFRGSIKRSVPYGNSGTLVTGGTVPAGLRPTVAYRVITASYASVNTGTLIVDVTTNGAISSGVNGENTTGIDTVWLNGLSYPID